MTGRAPPSRSRDRAVGTAAGSQGVGEGRRLLATKELWWGPKASGLTSQGSKQVQPLPPRVSEFQGPGQADFCHHGDQFFLQILNL